MKRICIDKRTGKVVNDFQGNPVPGTMTGNAVRAKLGKVEDFEEREVTDEEYAQHVAAMKEETRPEREAKALKRRNDLVSAKNKLKAVGLTDDEIKAMLPYLGQ